MDEVLLDRSQTFALAVQTGKLSAFAVGDFTDILIAQLTTSPFPKLAGTDWLDILKNGVREALMSEDPSIQTHLKQLADAYTLLAFLRQTPDVQGAVEKMFAHGKIWLDASVTLPLLVETLSEPSPGRFTRMINAAQEAGLNLFITPAIIEEIERHINRAQTCAQIGYRWEGSVPYLFERYIVSGRSVASFSKWLENFRGREQPHQDISDYLLAQFGIQTLSLSTELAAAPTELRTALQTLWYEAHQRQCERYNKPFDEIVVTRLIEHDIECYCGVVQLRKKETSSPFGYSAWWLTIDRKTFDLKSRLREVMIMDPPDSPILSADFMVNYLAFGPVRGRIGKGTEFHLPLMLELSSAPYLTADILTEAEKIRADLQDMPEHVIRRKVRDYLNQARRSLGSITDAGVGELEEGIIA